MKLVATIFMAILSFAASAQYDEMTSFGENPGNLQMITYSPAHIKESAPVVVLLHGCLQTAQEFASLSGWEDIAQERGFHLLLPQTNKKNNQYNCFNWFNRADAKRNQGEILSVVSMIETYTSLHKTKRKRLFVTGLSAGAAMAANLSATHPELFEAASFSAGVPFGCAIDALSGILCMNAGKWSNTYGVEIPTLWERLGFYQLEDFTIQTLPGLNPLNKTAAHWGKLVRGASSYEGIYPRVSIWHGTKDDIVSPQNATALLKQWTNVHDLKINDAQITMIDETKRSEFLNAKNEVMIELNQVNQMGHGWAISETCGSEAPYILKTNICTTEHVVKFFNL